MSKKYQMNPKTKKIEEVEVETKLQGNQLPQEVIDHMEDAATNDVDVYVDDVKVVETTVEAAEAEIKSKPINTEIVVETQLNTRCVQDMKVLKANPTSQLVVEKTDTNWVYKVGDKVVAEFDVPHGRWTQEP